MTIPVLELTGVSKQYGALRPLRVERLTVGEAETVAVVGLDLAASEIFVNLATGMILPDSGEVTVFGRSTASIGDSTDWLKTVDCMGFVGERVVLLEGFSVMQNLAVPFGLEIEPPPDDARDRAMALAREVGLAEVEWARAVGEISSTARARVRFARALAFDPAMIFLEHPTASMDRDDVAAFGRCVSAVAGRRGATVIALTNDEVFTAAAAARVIALDPATGRPRGRRPLGWFRSGH